MVCPQNLHHGHGVNYIVIGKKVMVIEKKNKIFKTNPVAKEVRTPQFKSKVIDSKKIYDRKKEQDELRESYEQSVRNRLERINDE